MPPKAEPSGATTSASSLEEENAVEITVEVEAGPRLQLPPASLQPAAVDTHSDGLAKAANRPPSSAGRPGSTVPGKRPSSQSGREPVSTNPSTLQMPEAVPEMVLWKVVLVFVGTQIVVELQALADVPCKHGSYVGKLRILVTEDHVRALAAARCVGQLKLEHEGTTGSGTPPARSAARL